MTEKIENNNAGSNRFLAIGIVFALILMGLSFLYIAKIFEKRLDQQNRVNSDSNPLITELEEPVGDGKPDIPGVVVYHAENDLEEINVDARKREEQFKKNIEKGKKTLSEEQQRELLRKKDEYAAKRLAFLRKIEEAETKEERLKLIEELKRFCEGNSTENKTKEPNKKNSKADIPVRLE